MKNLSTFEIVMIVLFALASIAGFGGVFYYYSYPLADIQARIAEQQGIIDKSTTMGFTPSAASIKTVDTDIGLIHAQMDPIIKAKLEPSVTKLAAMTSQSATVWRQHLDEVVTTLKNNAKASHVELPDGQQFYFGFSRFLNSNPRDNQTSTLNKQLFAIQTLAQKAIDLKVLKINGFKRTFDEDQGAGGGMPPSADKDFLPGYSQNSKSNTYHAYPIYFDFVAYPQQVRELINQVASSTDIFVIRTIQVQSSKVDSIKQSELSALAGPPAPPPQDTSPGAVASTQTMTKGPSYLFGNETVQVHMRIDLIEWLGLPTKK